MSNNKLSHSYIDENIKKYSDYKKTPLLLSTVNIENPLKNALTSKIKSFLDNPNSKLHGNSFDSQHLSNFILNSEYCKPVFSLKTRSTPKNLSKLLPDSINESINKTNISKNNNNSFFFKNGSRYLDEKNVVKALNNDFPSHYSEISPLYREENKINPIRTSFLTIANNIIDNETKKNNEINIFSKQMKEMKQEIKINEINKKMKESNLLINKQNRILKNSYKSGILNVDNPFNNQTVFYLEEHQKLAKKHNDLNISRKYQTEILSKYINTAPQIEFFNKNFDPKTKSIENLKITPNWTRKNHCNEKFLEQRIDTHTRVFSVQPEEYNIERAKFLRKKDVGDKDYNLIFDTKNDIEIKKREIFKVLG